MKFFGVIFSSYQKLSETVRSILSETISFFKRMICNFNYAKAKVALPGI